MNKILSISLTLLAALPSMAQLKATVTIGSNESWGCGGNMRPEFYADQFRRYQTYCRNYDGNNLYKVASGASDYDLNWTRVLMDRARGQMAGLSLHYYSVVNGWDDKGSALEIRMPRNSIVTIRL